MKEISILGCGWLGLPLGKHLASKGYRVNGSTTQVDKLELLERNGIRPFHLSFNPEPQGHWDSFFDSDVLLINIPPRNKNGEEDYHKRQLKEILDAAESRIEKLIFVSSTAVYQANNQEVRETDATFSGLTRGGIPLLEMEKMFTENQNFKTTVLRFGGLYGPDRHPGKFLAGKKDLSGAQNPTNMIHLDDCIGVIDIILENEIWSEIFNACSPSQKSRKSFYREAALSLGLEAPTFTDEPSPFKKVNCDKLTKSTGYQFMH